MNPLDLAQKAAHAALEKKAFRCILMDLRGLSDLCDYQLVCSAENDRQTRAVADAIEDYVFKAFKIKPHAVEGKNTGHWILMDYGATMVHVFFDYLRDYYALEQIWPKAKFVEVKLTTSGPAPTNT